MADVVFISYASDNWETVFKNAVVPMQQQYGLCVYADKAFDKVNDKWIVPMLRNVRGADLMIAFVSQSYIESYACFLELLTAVNNRKQIVFVSLEEQLHLGNTTDLPNVERGVKNEILNQGANIATNTNNTSNDLMRAMKSAYTSISTLLEQDALSKYDISDAFINFFRDASINRKTINDLGAVKSTIESVSSQVFDASLIGVVPKPVVAAQTVSIPASQSDVSVYQTTDSAQQPDDPEQQTTAYAPQSVAETIPRSGGNGNIFAKLNKNKKLPIILGAAGACILAAVIIIVAVNKPKDVIDKPYTSYMLSTAGGESGTYTGKWQRNMPNGKGTMTFDSGAVYNGEWEKVKQTDKAL